MRIVTFIAAFLMLVTSSAALSCGESLYRVGKGLTYREYVAPLPARILVVVADASELDFVDALQRAGHDVEAIRSVSDVSAALDGGSFDIVMSHYHTYPDLAQTLTQSSSTVALLPVADTSAEIAGARQVNRHAPMGSASLKQFLKAIHRTLKDTRA